MTTRRRQVRERLAYNRMRRSARKYTRDWKPMQWDVWLRMNPYNQACVYDVRDVVIRFGDVRLEGYVEDVEISVGFTL